MLNSGKSVRGLAFRGTDHGAAPGRAVAVELESRVLDSAVRDAAVGMAVGVTEAVCELGFGAGCRR